MALVTSAGAYEVGLAKQTNESTIPTVAAYAFPVFAGGPMPVQTTSRVEVTDAASIAGDEYKNPDEHWECTDLVVPGFDDSLGQMLVLLWPTDTATGTAPSRSHAFSGLGSTTSWVTMFDDFTNATLKRTFEGGQCSGMTFSADETGGPMKVGFSAVGKRPTVASYTKTVTDVLTSGYFTAQGATLQFEEDNATPVTHTNIQNLVVTVTRPVNPEATADGVNVNNLGITRLEPVFSMTLLWENWDAFRNTYFGTVGGSTPSATFAAGSVTFNFVHTVAGTSTFQLKIDKAWLKVGLPRPDPAGGPLKLDVQGSILKPASGDHVKPTLVNNVTPAY